MKIFISGPMSGKPNDNVEAFHNAELELKRRGYSVWNPAWQQFSDDTDFTREDIHDIDLRALEKCDAIYMLDGWEGSNGARVEYSHARALGKKIMYECLFSDNEWRKDIDASKHRGIMRYKLRTDIQNLYVQGYSLAQMSKITGVRISTVLNIVNSIDRNDKDNIAVPSWLKAVKDHDKQIDTLCGEITAMDDRVASVEGEVEAIKESIGTDNLQEQLEKDFADVYEEFQSTKDQVNDINMGYIKWSSEVSQFDERIEKLEENMKEIAANGGLGLSFNLMNERVSSNKRDISSLRNDIDDIHNWINAHDRMLKAQSSQMSDLGSELDEYIDDYKEAYKHLDNADEALERRIKAIENRLNVKPFYGPDDDD